MYFYYTYAINKYMVYKNKKSNKKTKLILAALLIALLAGGAVFALARDTKNDKDQTKPAQQTTLPAASNPDDEASKAKQKIIEEDKAANKQTDSAGLKPVKPVITYAGQYGANVEVGGYVGEVFEQGGTCTATFTLNAATLTQEVQAVTGAQSVDCPVMTVPSTQFEKKGIWKVSISYKSASATGTSDEKDIEIK